MNLFLIILSTLLSFAGVLIAFHFGKVYVYAYLSAYIGFALCGLMLFLDLGGYPLAFMEIAYGVWFLSTDILSEHYGPKEARNLVLTTTFLLAIFFGLSQLIVMTIPHVSDITHAHLTALLAPLPRIIGAGVIIFCLEQLLDVWLFHIIRQKTKGAWLWLRNCGSTMTTQTIDVAIFYPLAFAGVVPNLWQLMLVAWGFKMCIALLDTPFLYVSYKLRPKEL